MCATRVRTLTHNTLIASRDPGAKGNLSLLIPIASFGTRTQPKVHHVEVSLWKILLFTPGSYQVQFASLASQRILRRCPRDAYIFLDSTSYPQTVHSCRGLLPTNRITYSQTCFFRVSFWVTWSPSVTILIARKSVYVTSLRCQTGNLGSFTSTASPSTCVRIVFPESSVNASNQFHTNIGSSYARH